MGVQILLDVQQDVTTVLSSTIAMKAWFATADVLGYVGGIVAQ